MTTLVDRSTASSPRRSDTLISDASTVRCPSVGMTRRKGLGFFPPGTAPWATVVKANDTPVSPTGRSGTIMALDRTELAQWTTIEQARLKAKSLRVLQLAPL